MKKLLLSLALLFVFGVSSAYAKDAKDGCVNFSCKSEGSQSSGGGRGENRDRGEQGSGDDHHGKDGTVSVPAAPVPEPEEWAMLIVGFGLIGMRLLRKNDNEESTTLIG